MAFVAVQLRNTMILRRRTVNAVLIDNWWPVMTYAKNAEVDTKTGADAHRNINITEFIRAENSNKL